MVTVMRHDQYGRMTRMTVGDMQFVVEHVAQDELRDNGRARSTNDPEKIYVVQTVDDNSASSRSIRGGPASSPNVPRTRTKATSACSAAGGKLDGEPPPGPGQWLPMSH